MYDGLDTRGRTVSNGFRHAVIFGLVLIAAALFSIGLAAVCVSDDSSAATFTVDGFTYETSGTNATIASYSGAETTIYIPETVEYGDETYNVIAIKSYAFSNTNIISLKGTGNVTTIGDFAFMRCTDLYEVIINSNVTTLGSGTFNQCTALNKVTLENGVRSIDSNTFASCNLYQITIPESVTSISTNAFTGCANLQMIIVANGNPNYSSNEVSSGVYDGILYNFNKSKIVLCPEGMKGQITVISRVVEIGDNAFRNCAKISQVNISTTQEFTIGANAFYGCVKMTTLTGYSNVVSIGQAAFQNCSILDEFVFVKIKAVPDYAFDGCEGLTTITFSSGTLTSIGKFAFRNCSSLKSVNTLSGLTSIGESAFQDCTSLQSLTIANTVTALNKNTFAGCSGISSLTMPDCVSIQSTSFEGCTGLTNLYFTKGKNAAIDYTEFTYKYTPWYKSSEQNISVSFSSSTSKIGNYTFCECTGLTAIQQLSYTSAVSIGNYAFYGCSNLSTNLAFPGSTLKTIGQYAFYGCSSITGRIQITQNVTAIGDAAFGACTNVTEFAVSVDTYFHTVSGVLFSKDETKLIQCYGAYTGPYFIPETVTEIGSGAFAGCTGITGSLMIPTSVNVIGSYAFEGCTGLTGSLSIPNSVVSIGKYAFSNCSGLTGSLAIPDSVTVLGAYAFNNCSQLSGTINIPLNMNAVPEGLFAFCYGFRSLVLHDSITSIGKSAFMGCTGLTGTLTLTDNVVSIGDNAFYDCYQLNTLSMPVSLKVERSTFYNCIGLTTIILTPGRDGIGVDYTTSTYTNTPWYISAHAEYTVNRISVTVSEGIIKVGDYTFYNCSNGIGGLIGTIDLPMSLVSIGKNAFNGCHNITEIRIKDNVTTIGDMAMVSCWSMTAITVSENNQSYCSIGGILFKKDLTQLIVCPGGYAGSFTIPSSIQSINKYAFQGCVNLTGIVIPDTVTEIMDYTFDGCTSLASISMPIDVTFKNTSFSGCTAIVDINLTRGKTGFGKDWSGSMQRQYLPWNISKQTMNLTVEEGVTYIGTATFYACNLISVKLPVGCHQAASSSFAQCVNLASLTIPADINIVGTQGSSAFAGCYGLTSLTLIGDRTSGSPGTEYTETSVKLTPWYLSRANTIILTIEEGVASIGQYMFYNCTGISDYQIPSSMYSIGTKAFYGTNGTKQVVINKDLSFIGDMAFTLSPNIESFVVVEGNEYYSADNGILYKGPVEILLQCPMGFVGEYVIASSTTTIDMYAFYGCTSLTSIVIPSNVKILRSYAFYQCSSITSITMPAALGITSNDIFYECTSVSNIILMDSDVHTTYDYTERTYTFTPWFKSSYMGTNINLIIEDGITDINGYLFTNCSNLREVTIPDSVTNISTSSFNGANGIKKLTMPISVNYANVFSSSSVTEVHLTKGNTIGTSYTATSCSTLPWRRNAYSIITITLEDGITTLGEYSFAGAKQLTEITIPDSVIRISANAFKDCSALGHVTMPAYLEDMGEYVFANCTFLSEMTIKGSITEIPNYAFSNCTGLNSLSFESSTTRFGEYSLNNCSALTKLVIPETIEDIGTGAFSGCRNIADLTIPYSFIIDSAMFSGCDKVTHVTFTYGTGDAPVYSSTTVVYTPWYLNRDPNSGVTVEFIDPDPDVGVYETIPAFMFLNCVAVVSVTLPSTIENINTQAFSYTGLKEITIPDSVYIIGEKAFSNCSSLTTVIVGENVTYVGEDLFYNCQSISYLQIPASMPVSSGMYYNCNSLKTLVMTPGTLSGMTHEYSGSEFSKMPWYTTHEDLTIILNNGVTLLRGYIFYNCLRIVEIFFYDKTISFSGPNFGGSNISFVSQTGTPLGLNTANMASSSFSGKVDEYNQLVLKRKEIVNATGITIDEDPTKTVRETKSISQKYFTITATVQPEGRVTNTGYIWESSNPDVISISQDGTATILNAGMATLRVTALDGGFFTECVVTVLHNLSPVAYKAPNCSTMTDGNIEHYRCTVCNARFLDADAKIPITSWTIKAAHSMEDIAAKEATCREAGNDQCYHCKSCERYFSDPAGSMAINFPVVPKLDHNMTFVKGYDSSGLLPGITDHYHCSLCNMDYNDEFGTTTYYNLTTYDVRVLVNNDEYGSVSISLLKNVLYGSDISLLKNDLMIGDTRVIAVPTETTAQYIYAFSYWVIGAETVTAYTECTAMFTREIRSYTVTFYSADGKTPYFSDVLEYGTEIIEPNQPPRKEDTVMYTYSFSRWVDDNKQQYVSGMTVTGDVNYYPEYTSDLRTYRITFKNDDTVFYQYYLKYGEVITKPSSTPTKAQTASTVFVFIEWEGFKDGMVADYSYTFNAYYREDTRYYTATFMSDNDVFVIFDDLVYEQEIPDPGTPTKAPTDMYQFEFTSWDYYVKGVKITENVEYHAIYTKLLYAYTVDPNGRVYINSEDVTSFNISREAIIKLKQDAMSKTVSSFMIDFEYGAVELDSASILSLTNTKQKVSFDILEYDRMPTAMKNVVKERTVYNINIGTVHQFDGTLTITINYEPSPREDVRNLVIWYVTTSGTYQEIPCTYTYNQVSFKTNHLSYYSVILSAPSPDAEYWPTVTMVIAGVMAVVLSVIALRIFRRNVW